MRKYQYHGLLFAIMLLSFAGNLLAQSKKPADITTEGNAKLKVKPDMVTFTINVERADTVEKNAIRLLNEEMQLLSSSLEKLGFQNKAIKISDYKVSSSNYNEEKPKRYTATNILTLEFRLDNQLIDALYGEIQAKNFTDLDISYETGVSDSLEKAIRKQLVQLAIADAQSNADNITKSLGLTVSKIKQVYKNNDQNFMLPGKIELTKFTPPKFTSYAISFKTTFDRFEVAEIELEEKITIVYEVLN